MYTQPTTTDPPSADKSCPRCGHTTMKRVARRLGTGWADYLQCVECNEAVPAPRSRKRPAAPQDLPPLPPGELSARAGELDDLTRRAADNFEAICDQAVDAERRLLERAWGPLRRLPTATLHTIVGISDEVRGRMGDLLNVLTARIAQEAEEDRPPATGFVGWHRPHGKRQKWQPVVTAGSESDALDQLLGITGGDKVVLPDGRDPNREGRPR